MFKVLNETPPDKLEAALAPLLDIDGVLRFLAGTTPAHRIYEIDATLRPEGRQGALSRSLDGYRAYLDRWAETWERQALARARPVAGDHELGHSSGPTSRASG